MRFLVVSKQHGGCDYTIDCGVRVQELEADDVHGAIERVRRGVMEDGVPEGMDTITVYPIGDEPILCDWPKWMQDRENAERRREERSTRAQERAEYERLKAKFG